MRASTLRHFALAAVMGIVFLAAPPVGKAVPFDAEQKRAIETLVRDYLLAHPEVLDEAMRALQAKRAAEVSAQREKILSALREEIENDPATPVIGDPQGDVTLVQFFDYQCGYCKSVQPALRQLMEEDRRIRFVMKEFPILGPASVYAARASLATWNMAPAKYAAFHAALLNLKGAVTDDLVMAEATRNGLDRTRLKNAMNDPTIDAAIQRTYNLAETLDVTGTPAFIIGKRFVPGAVDLATLRALVAQARER